MCIAVVPLTGADQLHLYTVQTVVYDLLKRLSGTAPVYASLGNHDSSQS